MFTISDGSCTDIMMVSNVQGTINDENIVSVTWNWPQIADLSYCVVFAVEEDIPLEEILRKKIAGTVYEDTFGLRHTMELEKQSVMIKVYPARKVSNRDFELINQVKNNCSDVFFKKVNLTYHVDYKSSLFSPVKTAILQIHGIHELNEGYLTYRCVGEARSGIRYPIDVNKFGRQGSLEIHISRKEEIVLELTDKQKNYITLSRH